MKSDAVIPVNGALLLMEEERLLSFCSYDYLGLAEHPEVKKNAMKFLLEHGVAFSSSSREIILFCQRKLEERLSAWMQRDKTLLFSSRTEANCAALRAIGQEGMTILIEETSHFSLRRGAKESGAKIALFSTPDELEQLLQTTDAPHLVALESISSLTGEVALLQEIADLAKRYEALLYVDGSHCFGMAGDEGRGLCADRDEIDFISGSFAKACGAYGGFVSYRGPVLEEAMPTSLPPPLIGAIDAALHLLPHMEGERKQLHQRQHWLRNQLRLSGFTVRGECTPLVVLSFEGREEVQHIHKQLRDAHILSMACDERLLLALNICHMPDHCHEVLDKLCLARAESHAIAHRSSP